MMRSTKRASAAVLAAAAIGGVTRAETFRVYAEDAHGIIAVVATPARSAGAVRRLWMYNGTDDATTEHKPGYAMALIEIDCDASTHAVLYVASYDSTGADRGSDTVALRPEPNVPGSIFSAVQGDACYSGKKQFQTSFKGSPFELYQHDVASR